jgi:RHS repeat-associated protein
VDVGGTNSTGSTILYDARGLPSRVNLHGPGITSQDLAVQTRNVAGLVTKRRTDVTTAMGYVESNWTYDKLARVVNQVVQKGPGTTQVVRQNLSYFGNDDPKTLDHYLGTTQRRFQYGYDLRHQLTSTTETTTAGYFSATYDYGLAGRFTHAQETQTSPAPPGSDVRPRNVNYQYAGADPEQVTALTNVSDGQRFATYAYDAAGNQKTRCYGAVTTPSCTGELTEFVYDGREQLRRATKKVNGAVQGSEEYWYDGNGQRVGIVKRDAAGNKTEMIAFLGDTQAHYNAAGTIVHAYSHLSLGTPVARVDRTGPLATTVEYQFHGLSSNTLAAVDQGGTINASFSYSPYGALVQSTNLGGSTGIISHRRRFNDKYEDDISGLKYYGARYFDNTLVSWSQMDVTYRFAPDTAWSLPRRANLYATELNNPLRYTDPDGRDNPVSESEVAQRAKDAVVATWNAGPTGKAAVAYAASQAATALVKAAPVVGLVLLSVIGSDAPTQTTNVPDTTAPPPPPSEPNMQQEPWQGYPFKIDATERKPDDGIPVEIEDVPTKPLPRPGPRGPEGPPWPKGTPGKGTPAPKDPDERSPEGNVVSPKNSKKKQEKENKDKPEKRKPKPEGGDCGIECVMRLQGNIRA